MMLGVPGSLFRRHKQGVRVCVIVKSKKRVIIPVSLGDPALNSVHLVLRISCVYLLVKYSFWSR